MDSVLNVVEKFVSRFAEIPLEQLRDFASDVKVGTNSPGTFFARAGDTHDRIGLILQGLFRVYDLTFEGDPSSSTNPHVS